MMSPGARTSRRCFFPSASSQRETEPCWITKMNGVFCFQAEEGIRYDLVTGVQTCALPILVADGRAFADQQAGAGALGVVGDHDVVGQGLGCAVARQRRHGDAVGQAQFASLYGIEQRGHATGLSVREAKAPPVRAARRTAQITPMESIVQARDLRAV